MKKLLNLSARVGLLTLILALVASPVLAAVLTWTPATPAPPAAWLHFGELFDASGSGNDVYAVGEGFADGSTRLPLAYHYDGSNWNFILSPLPVGFAQGAYWGVTGSGNDVFSVGSGNVHIGSSEFPIIGHYNGAIWNSIISPALPAGWTSGDLLGASGSGNDVYAVGGGYNGSDSAPLIYHYDGSSWTAITPTFPAGWLSGQLENVSGSGNDVYAVGYGYRPAGGQGPLIYHYDGSSWTAITPAVPAGNKGYLMDVAGSGNDVYTVGYVVPSGALEAPLIYHYDGSNWSNITPATPPGLQWARFESVTGSGNDVYVTGYGYDTNFEKYPLIYHYNGSNWSFTIPAPPAGWSDGGLYGATGSGNQVYVVGFGVDGGDILPLIYHGVPDVTPPVVTVPSNMTLEATGPGGRVVTFSATATDETSPANPVVNCVPPSGSTFPLGTTLVTCSATDEAGNTGSNTFNVLVVDTTPPALNLPADMIVPQGSQVLYSATATDIVDGAVTVTCVPPSGSIFPLGVTTVNCSATDAHGNTANDSFTVTGVITTTFTSLGAYDGMLLELNETSGTGGTGNSSGATINIGDSIFKQQQLGLLHFDTSSLPNNAVVAGLRIGMKLQGVSGANPFTTHGNLVVDIASPFFGTFISLQAADFEFAPDAAGVGTFSPVSLGDDWYTADLVNAAFPSLNLAGSTQFRIGFSLGDDNDGVSDLLKFYSGNSLTPIYRPVLIVQYYVP